MIESVKQSDIVYRGKILNLRKDTVILEDGSYSEREIIEHAPAVCILPILGDGRIALIRQYRLATKQILLEAPAGVIDHNEDPLEAAKRELREETGYHAKKWTAIANVYMAPGFCDEYMWIYVAEQLTEGPTDFDHDERIETVCLTITEIENKIKDRQLMDAKTIVAFTTAKMILGIS